jgi:hypothetical protein
MRSREKKRKRSMGEGNRRREVDEEPGQAEKTT